MSLLDTFGQFYNSLSTVSLVMFWSAIFAFFFLIILSVNLYKKNKQLVFVIEELKKNLRDTVKSELDKPKVETNPEIKQEVVEPSNIKEEKKIEQVIAVKKEEVPQKEEVVQEKEVVSKQGEGPYSKNVLREISTRYQTSPISIKKEENKDMVNIVSISKEEINKPEKVQEEPKPEKISFAEEISKKMEEELKPQTIELTDYEKKQEEEAIISYQELLQTNKDRLYNITDEEETVDFIKELKSFRSSL